MLDVFLCYAPADQEIAGLIQARLDRCAEASVWLERCGRQTAQTMAAAWEGGSSSAAILLLLSPDAIPERLRREDWQPLLEHLEGNAEPPAGGILLAACPYPPLLERRHFFRWSDGAMATLRKIERWVMGLHRGEPPTFLPAPRTWFQGDKHELDAMWTALVDEPGTFILDGQPALAQEFTRVASGHFRDILWIGCGPRSQLSIASEIAVLGSSEGRLLLVLDDVMGDLPIQVPLGRRTSVLIIRSPRAAGLPMPPTDPPTDPDHLTLWEAMSTCCAQDIRLELAAQIANMNEREARVVAESLVARRCIDPLDAAGTRFRLGARSPAGHAMRRRHAEVLNEAFSKWTAHPARCRNFLPDVEAALEWTLVSDWPLATRLAFRAAAFLKAERRFREAAQIYVQLREAARERWDIEVFDNCSEELHWMQDEKGGVRPSPVSADQLGFGF